METKALYLHKIWLSISEAPGFNSSNVWYTDLSLPLGTSLETLEDLKRQFSYGELVFEQVVYQLIKDWFIRTENATLDKLLKVLSKVKGLDNIVDHIDQKHQSEINQKSCGEIEINSSQSIGEGKFGSVVYKGLWKGRIVAVKKITCGDNKFNTIVFNEATDLVKFDGNENIVKYYFVEKISGFYPVVLIALELCDITLERWVEKPDCLGYEIDVKNVLAEITRGLAYLHQNNIIHMNINPGNIMLVILKDNCIRVKLSDFGISKKISNGIGEIISKDSEAFGWMAPELLLEFQESSNLLRNKESTSSDIFALGCVFHYVLFKGRHLFGANFDSIQTNLLNYKPQIHLSKENWSEVGYIRLILMMIAKNPEERPPAAAVLKHHIFWSNVTTLQYLVAVRNSFENIFGGTVIDNCVYKINNDPFLLPYCEPFGSNGWIRFICPEIQTHVQGNGTRRVRYYGDLISDLIRLIRNMQNHYATLPLPVKDRVGTLPGTFLDYWVERFPILIDSIFMVFEKLKNGQAYGLCEYYSNEYSFSDKNDDEMYAPVVLRFIKLQCARNELKCFNKGSRNTKNCTC